MNRLLKNATPTTSGSPKLLICEDSLLKNTEFFLQNTADKKIRVATKSVRSLKLLNIIREHLGKKFVGLMAFDIREAIWLVDNGFNDVLIGYPQFDETYINKIAESENYKNKITLMVDSFDHFKCLEKFSGLKLCIDLDMSLEIPGLNFGVFRSSQKNMSDLKKLKMLIGNSKNNVVGMMGYEAQLAGVPDEMGLLTFLIKFLKRLSKKRVEKYRRLALREFSEVKFFNGGGTGSVGFSPFDPSINEVTIGSGFYCPTLFDLYEKLNLKPAIFFTLPVIRKPRSNVLTCLGGGYISSGNIGKNKLPTPVYPKGLKFIPNEMAGEVQTPLRGGIVKNINIGDSVFFRPAKAGEVCERFDTISLILRSGEIKTINTYRGDGKCFY